VPGTVKLGGMALANGVLVHGPTAWGCAVRLPDGELKTASAHKRFRSSGVRHPLLRGPAKVAEVFALLPQVKRALPQAQLPLERPRVLAGTLAAATGARLLRGAHGLSPAGREAGASLLALAPAIIALRAGEVAAYHGAEHISIGSYEHGERRTKEHERCGSHLVGPLVATTTVGNVLAAYAPPQARSAARLAASVGAIAASTELFAWMTRNPDNALAKALARPGWHLQHGLSTDEPTDEQLQVADAALRACLLLEDDGARDQP
jgi:uncharacterized protein YqhQ